MISKTIRNTTDLIEAQLIDPAEATAIAQVAQKYAIAISPQLQDILHIDGIRKQFVPTTDELEQKAEDLFDPIGDFSHSPIKGLVHRYPDRCLLQPVRVCPVYCRFCFRRETVGPNNAALSPVELEACFAYIRQHAEIWEVILSGGDPLILKPKQLEAIITKLAQISHVEIIRIHSRIPVLDSKRIDAEMLRVLALTKPIYVVLHINHPAEFTPTAIGAINSLVDCGVVLLGQSVLLKGINDDVQTLAALMRSMVKHRIKPYYLHHADLAPGTQHFRTTIEAGQKLMGALRGNYSGLCQPEYVLDIPGGAGKSPIGPRYVESNAEGYSIIDYKGLVHQYCDRS